ncbi:MAG: hypothetical protein Q9202_001247 [Teloschistes flavicans]
MASTEAVRFARAVSRTFSWSFSFYPQPLLNIRRRSTTGTTPAFPFINTLGFISYFAYTYCMFFSPLIRKQYAIRNPSAPEPTVRINDVVFTTHAVLLSTLTWSMYSKRLWGFTQTSQPVGKYIWAFATGCILGVLLITFIVSSSPNHGSITAQNPGAWAWIDLIYGLSFLKVIITIVKYCPQIYTNYTLKSTTGWSIEQILADVLGGVLSVAQICLDSLLAGGNWEGVTGNPAKFALGNITIVFDAVFLMQHYWLYRHSRSAGKRPETSADSEEAEGTEGERRGLLDEREEREHSDPHRMTEIASTRVA